MRSPSNAAETVIAVGKCGSNSHPLVEMPLFTSVCHSGLARASHPTRVMALVGVPKLDATNAVVARPPPGNRARLAVLTSSPIRGSLGRSKNTRSRKNSPKTTKPRFFRAEAGVSMVQIIAKLAERRKPDGKNTESFRRQCFWGCKRYSPSCVSKDSARHF